MRVTESAGGRPRYQGTSAAASGLLPAPSVVSVAAVRAQLAAKTPRPSVSVQKTHSSVDVRRHADDTRGHAKNVSAATTTQSAACVFATMLNLRKLVNWMRLDLKVK